MRAWVGVACTPYLLAHAFPRTQVHAGSDGRYYVLDTARVLPPQRPPRVTRATLIPSDDSRVLQPTTNIPLRPAAAMKKALLALFDVIMAQAEAGSTTADDDEDGDGDDDDDAATPAPAPTPRRRHHYKVHAMHSSVGSLCFVTIKGWDAATALPPSLGLNKRASAIAARTIHGPAIWLPKRRGEHLTCLLRQELVAAFPRPLVCTLALTRAHTL